MHGATQYEICPQVRTVPDLRADAARWRADRRAHVPVLSGRRQLGALAGGFGANRCSKTGRCSRTGRKSGEKRPDVLQDSAFAVSHGFPGLLKAGLSAGRAGKRSTGPFSGSRPLACCPTRASGALAVRRELPSDPTPAGRWRARRGRPGTRRGASPWGRRPRRRTRRTSRRTW